MNDIADILKDLCCAANKISNKIRTAGIDNFLGLNGKTNIYGEQVKKLDEIANDILVNTFAESKSCAGIASEELENPVYFDDSKSKYVLVIDPLDGSSNVDLGITVGTIFGIYKSDYISEQSFLQPGKNLVCAGYFLNGTSTLLIFSDGKTVSEYYLKEDNSFVQTRQNIKCPEGKTYSINDGNYSYWYGGVKDWKNYIVSTGQYSMRYVGSLVADAHRTLLTGGIFVYPEDTKNKDGKLRLLFECNPMAFIFNAANGAQTTGRQSILDINPQQINQKSPLVIGSKKEVALYEKTFKSRG